MLSIALKHTNRHASLKYYARDKYCVSYTTVEGRVGRPAGVRLLTCVVKVTPFGARRSLRNVWFRDRSVFTCVFRHERRDSAYAIPSTGSGVSNIGRSPGVLIDVFFRDPRVFGLS